MNHFAKSTSYAGPGPSPEEAAKIFSGRLDGPKITKVWELNSQINCLNKKNNTSLVNINSYNVYSQSNQIFDIKLDSYKVFNF